MQYVEVELNAAQKKQWTNTKTMFMWQAPGFSHILVTMLNPRGDENMLYWSEQIPTLATDGEVIIANPKFFFGLDLPERVAALGHEVIHAILDHMGASKAFSLQGEVVTTKGKKLPYDDATSNIAQDYIVNDFLVESRIGKLGKDWLHDTKVATQNDSWVDVYAKVYQKPDKGGKGGSQQGNNKGGGGTPSGNQPGRFDQHLAPGSANGKDPQQAMADRQTAAQQWQNAMATAKQISDEALGQGMGTNNQSKFFDKFLQPQVHWVDHLFGEFARRIGNSGYDFRKVDRRLAVRGIFAPGRSGNGADTIAVFMDSSGSIYAVPELINRFFTELHSILVDLKPRKIIVVWCDSSVKRVDIIEDENDLFDCMYKGAAGGGGTSFVPPFDWIKKEELEQHIDGAVYLTDLMGDFPKQEPPYPTIWCSISNIDKVPFGTLIKIPADGTA